MICVMNLSRLLFIFCLIFLHEAQEKATVYIYIYITRENEGISLLPRCHTLTQANLPHYHHSFLTPVRAIVKDCSRLGKAQARKMDRRTDQQDQGDDGERTRA